MDSDSHLDSRAHFECGGKKRRGISREIKVIHWTHMQTPRSVDKLVLMEAAVGSSTIQIYPILTDFSGNRCHFDSSNILKFGKSGLPTIKVSQFHKSRAFNQSTSVRGRIFQIFLLEFSRIFRVKNTHCWCPVTSCAVPD